MVAPGQLALRVDVLSDTSGWPVRHPIFKRDHPASLQSSTRDARDALEAPTQFLTEGPRQRSGHDTVEDSQPQTCAHAPTGARKYSDGICSSWSLMPGHSSPPVRLSTHRLRTPAKKHGRKDCSHLHAGEQTQAVSDGPVLGARGTPLGGDKQVRDRSWRLRTPYSPPQRAGL